MNIRYPIYEGVYRILTNHGNPVRILYCQWLGFHQLHVSFCLSHNLNLLIKHDRLYEPVFLFLTCFQIAFCLDCARLGGKKYRSEARMIFFQPTAQRAVALPNQRRKATFASKK